jgi:hypothetical protein
MHDQPEPTRTEDELVSKHGALRGAGDEKPPLLLNEEFDDA